MENETTDTVEMDSLGMIVVKSFAASLATTAGLIVALGAAGYLMERRNKKVVTLPETTTEEK